MHAPTHAIPIHLEIPGRVSVLTEKARLNRDLMGCRELLRWLRSLRIRYRGEPPQLGNERWDLQREMLQKPPTGSAIVVMCGPKGSPEAHSPLHPDAIGLAHDDSTHRLAAAGADLCRVKAAALAGIATRPAVFCGWP